MWRKLVEYAAITLIGLAIVAFFAVSVSAQTLIPARQGGTGWGNFSSGYLLFGNGTNPLATSTNLFWGNTLNRLTMTGGIVSTNSTSTNATTTNLFSTTASSTNLFASLFTLAGKVLTLAGNATISGTNTGDVTLSGTPDYITISGQTITRGTIDVSDDTNLTAGDGLTLTDDDIDCDTANGATFGCLSAANWTVFNNKVSSSSLSDLVSWTNASSSLWQATNFLSTGSSTLQAFTFTNATGTNATSTTLFSSKASTTALYLATGACDSLDVNSSGQVVCGTGATGGGGNSKFATSTGSDLTPNGGGGIIVSASSTIGGGTSGLTINGRATSTSLIVKNLVGEYNAGPALAFSSFFIEHGQTSNLDTSTLDLTARYGMVIHDASADNTNTQGAGLGFSTGNTTGIGNGVIGAAITHWRTGGSGRGSLNFYTKADTSTAAPLFAMTISNTQNIGMGTTTPMWRLQVSSSSGAQLTLSDPSSNANNHWSFRNAGGNFYLATSSATTFATSSGAAFTLDTNANATFRSSVTILGNSTTTNATTTSLAVTGSVSLMGETFTDFTDYVQSLFGSGSCLSYGGGIFSVTGNCIGDTQLAFDTGQDLTTVSTPSFSGLTISSLNQGWLHVAGAGAGVTSSTSPTVRSIHATSTATSTFQGGIHSQGIGAFSYIIASSPTATSTFGYGINILGGCFAVQGVCISAGGSGQWYTETPGSTVNGSNVDFTLAHTPDSQSLQLTVNGAFQAAGGVDYTLTGTDIAFVTPPLTSSIIIAQYTVGGVGGGGGDGAVDSVAAANASLTISPTTGDVLASLNMANANNWTALQHFVNASSTGFSSNYAAFGATGTTSINTAGLLTSVNSSSTGYATFNIASSTNYFGAGLASCAGGNSALTWSAGVFGCNTISPGGGGSGNSTWATTTSQTANVFINYALESDDVVAIGSNASTTAEWYYDPTLTVGKWQGRLERDGEDRLDGTPNSDHSAVGPTSNTFNAGESITEVFSVFLHSDGKWWKTDADLAASSTAMLGVHLYSGTTVAANSPLLVALPGSFVRDDSFNWTPGATIYLDTTTGAWTATAPSGTGDIIRIVGHAVTADVVWFNPSNDYLTAI